MDRTRVHDLCPAALLDSPATSLAYPAGQSRCGTADTLRYDPLAAAAARVTAVIGRDRDQLMADSVHIGLICARPAWLTLLTDVSAFASRAARHHARRVPLVGRRPYPDRSTYRLPPAPPAPADPAPAHVAAGAYWVSIVVQIQRPTYRRPAPSWPAAAHRIATGCPTPWDGHGHQDDRFALCLQSVFLVWVLLACCVASREPAGPAAPYQAVGQMTIHDNTAVDCR
jgi:hypothetical protein